MKKYINNKEIRRGSAFITVILIILVTILTFKMVSINHIKTVKKMDEDIINSHLELVKSYAFEYYIDHNNFPGDVINDEISYDNSLNSHNLSKLSEYQIYMLNNIEQNLNIRSGKYYIIVKDNIVIDVLYKSLK